MSQGSDKSAIRISLLDNGKEARVSIPGEFNPKMLDTDLLVTLAKSRGVAVDFEVHKRLEEIVQQFKNDQVDTNESFSQWKQPQGGLPGRIDWTPDKDPTATPVKQSDDEESADYYNLVDYICVTKGDIIGTWYEPTEGVDGADVTGQVIAAKAGKRCPYTGDYNLEIDNSGTIRARADGVLQIDNGTIKVSRLLEVNGFVDFSTGNIDFDGTIMVRRGVCDRFQVKATENIIVEGLIEAAFLECNGDLLCRRGMVAKNRGQIMARGNAQFGFLENVRGAVAGNLTVQREVLNCDLAVGKELIANAAAVIGGTLVVTSGMHVRSLGAAGETPTTIVLGTVPFLSSHLREYKQSCAVLAKQIAEKNEYLQVLKQIEQQLNATDKKQITELESAILQLKEESKEHENKHDAILEEMKSRSKVDIHVEQFLHPRVTLKYNGRSMTFMNTLRGSIHICCDSHGNLCYRIGEGRLKPIDEVTTMQGEAA